MVARCDGSKVSRAFCQSQKEGQERKEREKRKEGEEGEEEEVNRCAFCIFQLVYVLLCQKSQQLISS